MDVGLTGLIASKLAPTDFYVVRTCCEQLLPPVGASLLAIAVVQLHSALDFDAPAIKRNQKKTALPISEGSTVF
jgi:hypothetical protein